MNHRSRERLPQMEGLLSHSAQVLRFLPAPAPLASFLFCFHKAKRQNQSDRISLFSPLVETTAIHNCQ